jgi:CheY-like chemotaxis protein/HPt (histidine-containing phosphotransfer) domain-containing protein
VVLEVSATPDSGDSITLKFTVSDTGIGIPADKSSKIFEAFQQADTSTTRSYGGTGLGLAISTRLVELMGGNIWVESEVGKGSRFHFTACCRESNGESHEEKAPCPTAVIDARVLIVDDNATNRRILREMLASWGMNPIAVSCAETGLQLLQDAVDDDDPFQLLISDVNMPEIDGFMFVKSIRGQSEIAKTPVIMLTSGGRLGDNTRCEELGILFNLMKPVKQSELFDSVAVSLGVEGTNDFVTGPDDSEIQKLPPLRVLLAEDNIVNQKLVLGLLEPHGHHVTVANNGEEAVAAASSGDYDVILMDVQMPVLDGFGATGKIRDREKAGSKPVPIIAMTAHAMDGDRERCLEAGMSDYLSKPVRRKTLNAKLAEWVDTAPREGGSTNSELQAEPNQVDWSGARHNTGGDESLLRELMESCLEEAPQQLEEVRAAVEAGDAQRLHSAAHALKGTLLVFGKNPPVRHVQGLEEKGAQESLDGAKDDLASLESTMSSLFESLRSYLAEGSS